MYHAILSLKYRFIGEMSEDVSKQCSKACTSLDVSYGYPFIYQAKDGSESFITFYFKTSVAVRESRPAYDVASLFAEIGGYTGLLIGVSVFDFARMLKMVSEKLQIPWMHWNKNKPTVVSII